jgi:NhaA family Na+:H+ antiporter
VANCPGLERPQAPSATEIRLSRPESESARIESLPPGRPARLLAAVESFLRTESAGGVILLAATVAALVWANSPAAGSYQAVWSSVAAVGAGRWVVALDLRHWVNDGLMSLFFFVIGLEIKRELVVGELADRSRLLAPVAAALGGMVLPALAFLALNAGGPAARGWGIPIATDVAFAVGVLGLLGTRVAPGLRVLLLAIAIVDDVAAVLVIAVAYTPGVDAGAILAAGGLLAAVAALWRRGVRTPWLHVPAGLLVWLAVLESGVHATLAGVALGLLVPARPAPGKADSPLERLEHAVHPWSAYAAVPLFALANAGLPLSAEVLRGSASSPVAQGVALGLLAGKPLGVVGGLALAARIGGESPPAGSWPQLWGVGLLTGIGFTVSLFVTGLAFPEAAVAGEAKIGVFAASLAAALAGYAVLRGSAPTVRLSGGSPSR